MTDIIYTSLFNALHEIRKTYIKTQLTCDHVYDILTPLIYDYVYNQHINQYFNAQHLDWINILSP